MTAATMIDTRPHFDHLILAVPDPEPVATVLAKEWGLNVLAEGHSFDNGLANRIVPLEPPEYLELLFIRDADTFARQPDDAAKQRLLAGGGLLGWGLRTWDIDAVRRTLRIEPDQDTKLADGSSAPWRALEKPGTPLGFPFYIQYDASPEERMARWRARLGEADHRVPPGATLWVEVSGNVPELRAWLRPASHLDVRIVAGTPELRAAVSVGSGVLKLSSEIAGGIVPGDGPSVV